MIKTTYYEDYVIGESHETLDRTITETDIIAHAGQTGDFSPNHMDAEWVNDKNLIGVSHIAHLFWALYRNDCK